MAFPGVRANGAITGAYSANAFRNVAGRKRRRRASRLDSKSEMRRSRRQNFSRRSLHRSASRHFLRECGEDGDTDGPLRAPELGKNQEIHIDKIRDVACPAQSFSRKRGDEVFKTAPL